MHFVFAFTGDCRSLLFCAGRGDHFVEGTSFGIGLVPLKPKDLTNPLLFPTPLEPNHRGAGVEEQRRNPPLPLGAAGWCCSWPMLQARVWRRLGGWAAGRLGGWAAGRLGGWAAGRWWLQRRDYKSGAPGSLGEDFLGFVRSSK